MTAGMESARVAVIGAGLMGCGIAQVFATAGRRVRVYDSRAEALAIVHSRIGDGLAGLGQSDSVLDQVELAQTLDSAVADAEVVIEAVVEDLAVKQRVFAALDAHTPPDALLATNTSVISISAIAESTRRPERVLGTHWWNPAPLIPLVEVVPGKHTAAVSVDRMVSLLTAVGKRPVRLKRDVPGFIGNRMQHALWREAFAIVEAGIADPEDVDEVVKSSFGARLAVLGPIENADLVGLDMTKAIHDYLLPYLDAGDGVSRIVNERVEEGALGMKTGRGLRSWTAEEADAVRARLVEHLRRSQEAGR